MVLFVLLLSHTFTYLHSRENILTTKLFATVGTLTYSTTRQSDCLHRRVLRPATTFWHRPLDEFISGLDRAALAVHAVLGVDDELHLSSLGRIRLVLVHLGRAEALLRARVHF